MFILRQINGEGITSNKILGERYIVTSKQSHPDRFKQALKVTTTHPDVEKAFAIISFKEGQGHYPLYKGQHYYIMTPSGETFEKIKP